MTSHHLIAKLARIAFYCFILAFLVFNSFNYVDADLGWHLRVGREIITSGSLPHINQWNYTIGGAEWVDHEWLSNAIIYLVYDRLGYIALSLGFAGLTAGFLWWQSRTLEVLVGTAVRPLSYLVQTIGVLALSPHLGVRVQTVGLVAWGWLVFWLARYDRDRNPLRLWILPPVFWLWACLHGSFLLGLLVLAGYTAWPAVLWAYGRYTGVRTALCLDRQIITALLASVTATFLTPYYFGLYSLLWDYRRTAYMSLIEEWLPIYAPPILYYQFIYLALFLVAFILFWRHRSKLKFVWPGWWIVLTLITGLLALRSKRNFPLFYAVSFPWLVAYLTAELEIEKISARIRTRVATGIAAALMATGLASGVYFATIAAYTQRPFTDRGRTFPVQAVEFLQNAPDLKDQRLFNYYGWGGWLLWMWPEKPLFLDGRLPQEPFAGRTAIEEYTDFFTPEKTDELLRKYGIEVILFPRPKPARQNWWERFWFPVDPTAAGTTGHYFIDHLREHPDWVLAYSDDTALIFQKHQDR